MLDQPSNIETGWNDERVAELKRLWMDGLPASQIATELGGGLTRNSVLGKVHRLKLAGRTVARTKAQKAASGRAYVAASRRPNGKGQPKAPAIMARRIRNEAPDFETAPLPEEELGNDVTKLIGIMDLTKDTCRWPHGDPRLPGFGFCGARVQTDSPYCPEHTRRGTKQP
jgi:GcrA cell cycle regulator